MSQICVDCKRHREGIRGYYRVNLGDKTVQKVILCIFCATDEFKSENFKTKAEAEEVLNDAIERRNSK